MKFFSSQKYKHLLIFCLLSIVLQTCKSTTSKNFFSNLFGHKSSAKATEENRLSIVKNDDEGGKNEEECKDNNDVEGNDNEKKDKVNPANFKGDNIYKILFMYKKPDLFFDQSNQLNVFSYKNLVLSTYEAVFFVSEHQNQAVYTLIVILGS